MTEPLWSLGAIAMSSLLIRGEVAPAEVLASIEERVRSVNPVVNALPTLCFDRARARLGKAKGALGAPLAGLPVPIKDSYAVAGVRTTFGSRAFETYVPDASDYVVEAVEQAGGVVYAKSNTPEFEAGANTFNDVFGATLNPWNTERSAAGSSGGAAVSVATGMAFFAQGSDFACSLRYPASFCGVVGLRPSPGLVPQGPGPLPLQTLSVIGPLARDVADAGFALSAMCRFDERDPLSRPIDARAFATAGREPRGSRCAYSPDLGVAIVAPDIREIVDRAVAAIESAGATVADACPDLSMADQAFRPLRAFQFAAIRAELLDGPQAGLLKPEVAWNIREGLKLTALELAAAERQRAAIRSNMVEFLRAHAFLLSPTAPVTPFPVGQRYVEQIGDHRMESYLDWLKLGYAVTATGCPAISIPCGKTRDGLPVGLQIVGRPYAEAALLAFAAWCEGVLGARLERPIDPIANA
jgi:amidase